MALLCTLLLWLCPLTPAESYPLHRAPGKSCAPSVDRTGRSKPDLLQALSTCSSILETPEFGSDAIVTESLAQGHRILEEVFFGLAYREAVVCYVAQGSCPSRNNSRESASANGVLLIS